VNTRGNRICSGCDKFIEYLLYTLFFFISSSKSVLEVFATIAILLWFVKKFIEFRDLAAVRISEYKPSATGIRSYAVFLASGLATMVMVYAAIVMTMGVVSKHVEHGYNLFAPHVFIPIVLASALLLSLFCLTIFSMVHSRQLGANLKLASLAFLAVSVITAGFTTSNITISGGTLIFKTMEYFLLFLVIVDVINTREKVAKAAIAFIAQVFIVGLDGIYQYFSGHDIFRHFPLFENIKVTATFKFSNSAGTFFATVLPVPLSLVLFNAVGRRKKLLLLLVSFVVFVSLLLTQARAAWLGFFVAFLFMCVLAGRKKFFSIIGVLSLVVVLTALFGPQGIKDQLKSFAEIGKDQSSQDRLIIWDTGWRMFTDKPLFGLGLGTFMNEFERYRPAGYSEIVYAHNCLLQTAVETGITGVAVSLWIAAGIFLSALRRYFSQKDVFVKAVSIGFLAGVAATLVNSLFDTNLYSLPLAVLFWSVAGLSVTKIQDKLPDN